VWPDLIPVENDRPQMSGKWENAFYRVFSAEYDRRGPFRKVTRLMIVPKDQAPFESRWRDFQRIKNVLCGPTREAVEIYPVDDAVMDHGDGYHLWVLPEGKGTGLAFRRKTQPISIWIDCGAHEGVTVRDALDSGNYDKICAFEPCPEARAHPRWKTLQADPRVMLMHSAVWVEDTTLDFFENAQRPASQSGSVMREKTSGGIDTTTPARTVKATDFAAWMKRTVRDTDTVTVKMDIEGAEFVVLEHLCATGAIRLIDTLRIEWHATKLAGDGWQKRKERLISAIRVLGVEIQQNKDTDE